MTTKNIIKTIAPAVGDGATVYVGSDSYAATVSTVSPSGKTVTIRRDEVFHLSGSDMTGDSVYTTLEDPEGAESVWTLRANGKYMMKNVESSARFFGIHFGIRRVYQNPSY